MNERPWHTEMKIRHWGFGSRTICNPQKPGQHQWGVILLPLRKFLLLFMQCVDECFPQPLTLLSLPRVEPPPLVKKNDRGFRGYSVERLPKSSKLFWFMGEMPFYCYHARTSANVFFGKITKFRTKKSRCIMNTARRHTQSNIETHSCKIWLKERPCSVSNNYLHLPCEAVE